MCISTKGIRFANTFWEEEVTYGYCPIYQGLKPVYVLSLISKDSGEFIEEFNFLRKKYKLNTFNFLDRILRNTTNFSIKPTVKNGFCFFIYEKKEMSLFVLDYIDFDKIWYSLTKTDIEKIIKKTKRKTY